MSTLRSFDLVTCPCCRSEFSVSRDDQGRLEVLEESVTLPPQRERMNAALRFLAGYFNMSVAFLTNHADRKKFAQRRHIAIWVFVQLRVFTYERIGRIFGGRDHSTIINACQEVAKRRQDASVLAQTNQLAEKVRAIFFGQAA